MARAAEEEHPVKAFGWAARDSSGHLSPFHFSRRETGEEDVRFKILYCGMCHTDLHLCNNDWRSSIYPLVPGKASNGTYNSTTWQVIFKLEKVTKPGNYTLQLALASATYSELQVRFNNGSAKPAHFTTGLIGKDNAIARHGIHGLYWLYTINVPSFLLHTGDNTIYLTQSRSRNPFQGVMYDYIRLEGPPLLNIFNTDLEEALDFSRLSTT